MAAALIISPVVVLVGLLLGVVYLHRAAALPGHQWIYLEIETQDPSRSL